MAAVLFVTALAYMLADPQTPRPPRCLDRRPTAGRDYQRSTPGYSDSPAVETEVQVLRSPAIAAAVVDELQLANRPGFGLNEGQWPGVGSRDQAIGVVSGGLDVSREGTSYAISVSFTAEDPLLAARIVNSTIDSYTSGQKTSESLERTREIGLLRDRLGCSRRLDPRKVRGAVPGWNESHRSYRHWWRREPCRRWTLSLQRPAPMGGGGARAAARAARRRWSPTINALRNQLSQLRRGGPNSPQRYGPDYPTLVGVNEQLKGGQPGARRRNRTVRQGRRL